MKSVNRDFQEVFFWFILYNRDFNDTTVQVDEDELLGMEDDIMQSVLGKRKRDVGDIEDNF